MKMQLSKLRADEKKSKELSEEKYTIEQLGQDSEKKAVPLVAEVMKEKEVGAKAREEARLNRLESAKVGGVRTYITLLTGLLEHRMRYVDWVAGWTYKVGNDGIGIILEMYSPNGKTYRAAFKPTMQEIYDLNAVNTYGLRAENTMEKWSKSLQVEKK